MVDDKSYGIDEQIEGCFIQKLGIGALFCMFIYIFHYNGNVMCHDLQNRPR